MLQDSESPRLNLRTRESEGSFVADFEGSIPDKIKIDTFEILAESQSNGAVLNA
jgi:hypothetical protein